MIDHAYSAPGMMAPLRVACFAALMFVPSLRPLHAQTLPVAREDFFTVNPAQTEVLDVLANDMAGGTSPLRVGGVATHSSLGLNATVTANGAAVEVQTDTEFLADEFRYHLAESEPTAAAWVSVASPRAVAIGFQELMPHTSFEHYSPPGGAGIALQIIRATPGHFPRATVVEPASASIAGDRGIALASGQSLKVRLPVFARRVVLRSCDGPLSHPTDYTRNYYRQITLRRGETLVHSRTIRQPESAEVEVTDLITTNEPFDTVEFSAKPALGQTVPIAINFLAFEQVPPSATADETTVVPGTTLSLPLLANDTAIGTPSAVNLVAGDLTGAQIVDDPSAPGGKMLVWPADLATTGVLHASYSVTTGKFTSEPVTITVRVEQQALARGTHSALIVHPRMQPSTDSTGLLRFSLGAAGRVTGIVFWRDKRYSFRGQVNEIGILNAEATAKPSGARLPIKLEIFGHESGFRGSIGEGAETIAFSRGARTTFRPGRLTAGLSMFIGDKYSLGYSTGTIGRTGGFRLSGRMPMGWPFTLTGVADDTRRVVIYQKLNSGGGKAVLIYGQLDMPASVERDSLAALRIAPSSATPSVSDARDSSISFEMGYFVPPPAGRPSVAWGSGWWKTRISFFDPLGRIFAELPATFSGNDQLLTRPSSSASVFGFSVNRQTGLFRAGILTRTHGMRSVTGVFVQPWQCGVGQIQGAGPSGAIKFDPTP